MADFHPLIVLLIQAGAVAGALTAIALLIERIWGPVRRWLANALTNPLIDKLGEMEERWDDHTDYVRHHLGPNGTTQPLHERVEEVQTRAEIMEAVAKENQRRLTMLEEYLLGSTPATDAE